MSLKDNRKLHFAVGLTAIIIAIRWLLTGDLLMAVEAAKPPADGETKSIALMSVLGPMLIEACVIVGASLVAWTLNLWNWLVSIVDGVSDRANQVRADPALPEPVAAAALVAVSQAADTPSEDVASRKSATAQWADPQSLVAALAQAVAIGDAEAEAECKKEIRKPYLRVELSECISTANYTRAREIITELEAISTVPAATKAARRARGNSAGTGVNHE